jgi:hypothetical protein
VKDKNKTTDINTNTNTGSTTKTTVQPPVLTTTAISSIAQTTAVAGNITSDGGSLHRVCWSTDSVPTLTIIKQ